jgi:hypothetical protein
MAKATARVVEKVVKETQGIVLELTPEEAEWLRDYVGMSTSSREACKDIYDALCAPTQTDDGPVKVGDKVRIIKAAFNDGYNDRIGHVNEIDEHDNNAHYRVSFSDGDYDWARTVERVYD